MSGLCCEGKCRQTTASHFSAEIGPEIY